MEEINNAVDTDFYLSVTLFSPWKLWLQPTELDDETRAVS